MDGEFQPVASFQRIVCTFILLLNDNKFLKLPFRGCVVTMECVEKLIKKDMLDPIKNTPLKDSDIIPLQRVRIILQFVR